MLENQLSATKRLEKYIEEQIKFLREMQNRLEFERNSLYAIVYGYYISFEEARLNYHIAYPISTIEAISWKSCKSKNEAEKHNERVLKRFIKKEGR
jgi:hypothetical protein